MQAFGLVEIPIEGRLTWRQSSPQDETVDKRRLKFGQFTARRLCLRYQQIQSVTWWSSVPGLARWRQNSVEASHDSVGTYRYHTRAWRRRRTSSDAKGD